MSVRLVLLCCAAAVALVLSADVKEVSITTIKEEPYVMSRDSGSELEGYCIDLITQLSDMLGFKYKLHLVKDGRYGVMESGVWNGMIGEILRGEADLAVAPLTLTAVRVGTVDMTAPFIHTGLSFMLHRRWASEDGSFSLLAPFSSDMWAAVLLAFLLTGVCMFLLGRISPVEWAEPKTDQPTFTLLHSFWYITGALTLQGAGPHPKALSGRVISAIWWLFTVLLLASYFGNFHLMLHSNNKQSHIKSFEDLANQDVIDYGGLRSGSTHNFFRMSSNPLYRQMYQHMVRKKSFVPTMEEGLRRTLEGNFAFIGEAVSLDYAVARHCNLSRSQDIISMRAYSIAGPLGSTLVKNLSTAVLVLSEKGELTYLRDKWWKSSCVDADGEPSSGALHSHQLCGLFVLLGVGLALGLLLGLLELLSRARSQAKDSKKSCCSVLTSELNQRLGSRGASAEQDDSDRSKA